MKKKKFKSLELYVKSIINNFNVGSHLSILKDSTSEIDVVRQYQSGDRKLDSRSSLKSNLAMSMVFNPEKEITLYILLDSSSSQFNKMEMCINSSLFLSYLSDMSFDKISLISFSTKINEIVLPSNDSKNINFVLEKIYNKGFDGISNIDLAINYLAGLNPTNALIFIISDFSFELSNIFLNNLKLIGSNVTNKVVGLGTLNLDELSFTTNINCTVRDSESNQLINLSNDNLRSIYNEWLKKVKINFNKSNCDFLIIDNTNYLNQISKYLLRK